MTPRRIMTACAIAVLVLSTGASAQPPAAPVPAVTARPELAIARAADAEVLEVRYFAEKEVFENSPDEAGTPVTHSRHVVETRVVTLDLKQMVAKRVDGSEVTSKTLVEELASEKPVLLVTVGQQIDPVLLEMFKPDTLVLQRPAPAPVPVAPGTAPLGAQPRSPVPGNATPPASATPPAPALPKPARPLR